MSSSRAPLSVQTPCLEKCSARKWQCFRIVTEHFNYSCRSVIGEGNSKVFSCGKQTASKVKKKKENRLSSTRFTISFTSRQKFSRQFGKSFYCDGTKIARFSSSTDIASTVLVLVLHGVPAPAQNTTPVKNGELTFFLWSWAYGLWFHVVL
jgi:hypothetical protein